MTLTSSRTVNVDTFPVMEQINTMVGQYQEKTLIASFVTVH